MLQRRRRRRSEYCSHMEPTQGKKLNMPDERTSRRAYSGRRAPVLAAIVIFGTLALYLRLETILSFPRPPVHQDENSKVTRLGDLAETTSNDQAATTTSQKNHHPLIKNDILLFVEIPECSGLGIGFQLNNYVLTILVALYTNRRLVRVANSTAFDGGSFFGCPNSDSDNDLPLGLGRIVQTPEWLSGNLNCSEQDIKEYSYGYWKSIANENFNGWLNTSVTCWDAEQGGPVSILPLDFHGIRKLAPRLFGNDPELSRNSTLDFYSRLGATPTEMDALLANGNLVDMSSTGRSNNQELWDMIVSLLNRMDMISFQPWIQKDVQARVERINLPETFIAIHVRRGDKLEYESRSFVVDYWRRQGYHETTMPHDYIPFSFYMKQIEDLTNIQTIYVATDDPATVRHEIANLTNPAGHVFILNPDTASATGHVHDARGCQERYSKSVVAITDLAILTKSHVFVGDFNSNWGRLVRVMRTSFVNNGTTTVAGPRRTRSVFGDWLTPGF